MLIMCNGTTGIGGELFLSLMANILIGVWFFCWQGQIIFSRKPIKAGTFLYRKGGINQHFSGFMSHQHH